MLLVFFLFYWGKGTKLSKYLIEHDKEYEVLLQLGTKTTTADEEGEEVEKKVCSRTILAI